jgi:hypothetical protein
MASSTAMVMIDVNGDAWNGEALTLRFIVSLS